jgi:hypothetical protein
MTRLLACLASVAFGLSAAAQEKPAAAKLRLRAVLHDPLSPHAELYVRDAAGALVRLNLALEGLTEAQTVPLADGTLQLFSSATVDPAKPLAQLAATVAVPAGVKRAIVFLFPTGGDAKPPYRAMVIDDGPAAFPKGETRVLNLTKLELAMKAGEHSVKLPAAAVSAVPKVTKRNDLNQAQTEFYRKMEGNNEWQLLAERPMQFTDGIRNIILVYQMPKVAEPQLRTLVDTDLP